MLFSGLGTSCHLLSQAFSCSQSEFRLEVVRVNWEQPATVAPAMSYPVFQASLVFFFFALETESSDAIS